MRLAPLLILTLALSNHAAAAADPAAQPAKQIHQMTPAEAHRYIAAIESSEPSLRKRVAAIGRKFIGQPYKLNLLGEYPYQLNDGLPMFSLEASDCVVFAEHVYAMALSASWEQFFWTLQRIRYKDGVIGVATRNHYTEVDWNVNNRWLVIDISARLSDASYDMTVDRATFLKTRHKTDSSLPVQTSREAYVPKERVADALVRMQEGDMVNVISTRDGNAFVTHVGLVVQGQDGKLQLLHSSEPAVREESFDAFIARAEEREQRNALAGRSGMKLAGFKFLRLNEQVVVPPAAPQPRP